MTDGIKGAFNVLEQFFNTFSSGTKNASANGESNFSFLSVVEGDSAILSKGTEILGNLKANFHESVGNFMKSGTFQNISESLSSIASTIDGLEIPDKIYEAVSEARQWIINEGIVGEIAGGVMSAFYGVGQFFPPPAGTIVSAMSEVIKPDAIELIINKTLEHAEQELFSKMDADDSAFTAFRKKFNETISATNIAQLTTYVLEDVLETTYAATGENATSEEILGLVKKNFGELLETEIVKDAKVLVTEKTMPALMETGKNTLNTVKAVGTDKDIVSEVKDIAKGLPGLMTTSGQAIFNAIKGWM